MQIFCTIKKGAYLCTIKEIKRVATLIQQKKMTIEILRSQIIPQEIQTSVFLKKSAPKFAESVVGKWVLLVSINNFIVTGTGDTKDVALENAIQKFSDYKS